MNAFRRGKMPSDKVLQELFPTRNPFASDYPGQRKEGDERMEDQSGSLSQIVIKAVSYLASEDFKRALKDKKKRVTITSNTSLQCVLSSLPKYQFKRVIIQIAEHCDIDLPKDNLLEFTEELRESMRSVGDLQDWLNAELAKREGVQEKVPVQTGESKAIA